MMAKRSMRKRSTVAQKTPLLLTTIGVKPWMNEYRSHGTGRLLSKMTKKMCGTKISHYSVQLSSHCSSIMAALFADSPHSDVKDVTAHTAGYSHVPQAFTSHDHTGNEVRVGCHCCQNRQKIWGPKSFSHLQKNKNKTSDQADTWELLPWFHILSHSARNLNLISIHQHCFSKTWPDGPTTSWGRRRLRSTE